MQTEFQRRRIIVHLLLYYLFWSLPNQSRPNFLAHLSISPQSLAPKCSIPNQSPPPYCSLDPTQPVTGIILSNFLPDRSISPTKNILVKLAPQSLSPFHPPSPWYYAVKHLTPRSLAPHYLSTALTHLVPGLLLFSLVLFCQIFLWFLIFLALTNLYLSSTPDIFPTTLVFFCQTSSSDFGFYFHSPIDSSNLPLNRYLVFCCRPWYYTVKYSSGFYFPLHSPIDSPIYPWLILNQPGLLLSIDSHCSPWSISLSHPPGPWSSAAVPGIMLSNFFLWFRIFLALPNQ